MYAPGSYKYTCRFSPLLGLGKSDGPPWPHQPRLPGFQKCPPFGIEFSISNPYEDGIPLSSSKARRLNQFLRYTCVPSLSLPGTRTDGENGGAGDREPWRRDAAAVPAEQCRPLLAAELRRLPLAGGVRAEEAALPTPRPLPRRFG